MTTKPSNHPQDTLFPMDVIGIPINTGSVHGVAKYLLGLSQAQNPNGRYVCVANVHMLTIARQTSNFKTVLENASLVIPDGMPLVWTQKIKGFKAAQRVSGPDLMLELCKLCSQNSQSIFLLGANQGTLDLLSKNLVDKFPGLVIAGSYAPEILPEHPQLDAAIAKKINDSGARFLFVGLGCPKQEYWCASYAPHLNAIAIGVGAAFDFHAGTKNRPPLWVQKIGFEWLYRLSSEPRRLWKRYLYSNTHFLYLSLRDFLQSLR